MEKYTFQELIDIARGVIKEFEKVEQKKWAAEGAMIELAKQSGELARCIMVYEKYYTKERKGYEVKKENIADELADILYSLIRLADHYGIDLEEAHLEARRNELKSLGKTPDF